MIEFCKDYLSIGNKTLNVNVYIELEEDVDYISGIGATVDTSAIANKALQNSTCLENKNLYGVFGKILKNSCDLWADDCYDYPSLEDMLARKESKGLEQQFVTVFYINKVYKTYIYIYAEK